LRKSRDARLSVRGSVRPVLANSRARSRKPASFAAASIDILESRPDLLYQTHDTVTGSHWICSGDPLYLRDGFLQALAGEM
jgi:hypothetical protein